MDDLEIKRKRLRYLELKQKESASASETSVEPPQSMIGKGWQALGEPARLAGQGLNQMGDIAGQALTPNPEVTGNLPRDIAMNSHKIMNESMMGALAKVAPGFVSPEAGLGAIAGPALGAIGRGARTLAKPLGRHLGEQAEGWAGMVPGSLREAFNNSGAMFAKGKKAASPHYEEGKMFAEGMRPSPTSGVFDKGGVFRAKASGDVAQIEELREIAKGATDHRTLFDASLKLDKLGALEPDMALEARKAMFKIKNTIPKTKFIETLNRFGKIISSNPSMAEGDRLFKKGLMAESLRQVFPKNKHGTTSAFKTAMSMFAGIPGLASSPVALGAGSTAMGLAGRKVISPLIDSPSRAAMTAVALLKSKREEND